MMARCPHGERLATVMAPIRLKSVVAAGKTDPERPMKENFFSERTS
jgi:hypothetical protein